MTSTIFGHVAPEAPGDVSLATRPSNNDDLEDQANPIIEMGTLTFAPQPPVISTLHTPIFPTELWQEIFQNLPITSIKSLRLVCRALRPTTTRFLFQPSFIFRPSRHDFERFSTITSSEKDPLLASSITSLRFEIGIMDIYHASTAMGCAYKASNNYAVLKGPPSTVMLNDIEMEKACEEYAAWNLAWHACGQDYTDVERLTSVFQKLTILRRIEISLKATEFDMSYMLRAWVMGCHSDMFPKNVAEFTAILLALQECPKQRLQHLIHDQLPVTFFLGSPTTLPDLISPLQHLETLNLTFDATRAPPVKFWKGLGLLLRSTSRLKDLQFGFNPLKKDEPDSGLWFFAAHAEMWYVPLEKMLGDHVWPKLQRLRLDGLVLCEDGLYSLLSHHSKTLRVLELREIALWQGSFQSLFTTLRDYFSLEKCHVWDTLHAYHSTNEAWRIQPCYNVETEPYAPDLAARVTINNLAYFSYEFGCEREGLSHGIEDFVVRGGEWPMTAEDCVHDILHNHNHHHVQHGPECGDRCTSTYAGDSWDTEEEEEDVDEEWEPSFFPTTYDEQGKEITEQFDEDGYDMDGYDADGFDHDGDHFSVMNDGQNICRAEARWRVLRNILGSMGEIESLKRKAGVAVAVEEDEYEDECFDDYEPEYKDEYDDDDCFDDYEPEYKDEDEDDYDDDEDSYEDTQETNCLEYLKALFGTEE